MNLIFPVIIFAGVAMVIYAAYGILISAKKKVPLEEIPPQASPDEQIPKTQDDPLSLVAKLEDRVYQEKEAEAAKKESQPQEKLLQEKEELLKQSEERLNKLRGEFEDIKKKLAYKEKEITEEFSKGVNLNKNLNEAKLKIAALQKEVKEKFDQIEAQKHQIQKYIEQEGEQAKIVGELKNKEEGSGWVSKDEFNNLNTEYAKSRKELEVKEEKLRKLVEELEALKSQLIDKASFETGSPKPEEPKDTPPKEEPELPHP